GRIAVWHIFALSVAQGLIDGFDIPTRQAFVLEIVERKESLANAIALNSFVFNAARLLGPCIAGVLIATVGEGLCFLFDGISYLAAIGSLAAMRIPWPARAIARPSWLVELQAGLRYAWSCSPIAALLSLVAWMSLTGMSYAVLMPVFAKDVFHGDPQTYGFLMAASGLGALGGAGYLAVRRSILGLDRLIAASAGLAGISLIVFAGSRTLWWSGALLASAGFWFMVHAAATNTVLQTIVDDDKRGRVMSLFVMAFMGTMPLGSLLAGHMAEVMGAPRTVFLVGILCLVGASLFARALPALRETARPIYEKLEQAQAVRCPQTPCRLSG
ncbi:MAG: MFS transporter, partial [Nitrospinae bacterium]|nr:MFS transporter [Nitrospinota bacterium]